MVRRAVRVKSRCFPLPPSVTSGIPQRATLRPKLAYLSLRYDGDGHPRPPQASTAGPPVERGTPRKLRELLTSVFKKSQSPSREPVMVRKEGFVRRGRE